MGFTNEAQLLTALRQARPFIGYKSAGAGSVTDNSLGSTWRTTGATANPWLTGSVAPASGGETLDRTSVGAYPIPAPVSGLTRYLLRAKLSASASTINAKIGMVYDRLVHCSGASANNANEGVAQTLNTVALPSRAVAANVAIGVECHGSVGSAGTLSVTVSYTNQAGTSGRTTGTVATNNMGSAQFFPMPLQAGDLGVQSVQSLTCTGTTGANVTTTGLIGVTLYTPIFFTSLTDGAPANEGWELDWRLTALAAVPDEACLALALQDSTNNQDILLQTWFGYA